jgi:hypothetical protein
MNSNNILLTPPSEFHFELINDIRILFRTGLDINYYNYLITYANENNLWDEINDEVNRNQEGWIKMLHDVCLLHYSYSC